MSTNDERDAPTPQRAIRRFDVFAEYSRQEREEKGSPPDEAKGYGIWLAKVVAARRFGGGKDGGDGKKGARRLDAEGNEPKFRSVGDELQTDETFDHDIVDRMGLAFYRKVFAPAIQEAREAGKSYEDIRDALRKDWKPAKSKARS
jgi:hypothetical protein